MPVIKAQQIPQKKVDLDEIKMKFCLYYPQYKYHELKDFPFTRMRKMLSIAIKEEAQRMYNLTQIVAAPRSKKGLGVKKLLKHFKKIMEE